MLVLLLVVVVTLVVVVEVTVVVTDSGLRKAMSNAAIPAARRSIASTDKNIQSGEQAQQ